MAPGEITDGPFHDGTLHGHHHASPADGPGVREPHSHPHGHPAAGVTHSHPHHHGTPDLAVAELAARLGPRRPAPEPPAPLPRREPGQALARVRELFPASPETVGAALAGFRAAYPGLAAWAAARREQLPRSSRLAYPRAPRREGPWMSMGEFRELTADVPDDWPVVYVARTAPDDFELYPADAAVNETDRTVEVSEA